MVLTNIKYITEELQQFDPSFTVFFLIHIVNWSLTVFFFIDYNITTGFFSKFEKNMKLGTKQGV